MRGLLERSLPWILGVSLLLAWSDPPPLGLDGLAHALVLSALLASVLVLFGLRLLHNNSIPNDYEFEPLEDEEAIARLRARVASLLAAGWEEGPPLIARGNVGQAAEALPLFHPGGTSYALVMNPLGNTEEDSCVLELLTTFEGGLRLSTVDRLIAGAFIRPRYALAQIFHGASDDDLWSAHEKEVQQLASAGARVAAAQAGSFKELLRESTRETFVLASARPLWSVWIVVWRLLFAAPPYALPLRAQPGAVRELGRRGFDVKPTSEPGQHVRPIGLGGGTPPAKSPLGALVRLSIASAIAVGAAAFFVVGAADPSRFVSVATLAITWCLLGALVLKVVGAAVTFARARG